MIKFSDKNIIGYFFIKNGIKNLYHIKIFKSVIILFILILLSYFSYIKLYINPKEEKALKEFFYAKKFFLKKKYVEALGSINNNKGYLGFLGISKKYFLTKTGNLSKYYAGLCFYKLKQYKKSISLLKYFNTDEEILISMKYGLIGDAMDKLNNQKIAVQYYIIAANISNTNFSNPFFLYKAATLFYSMNNFIFANKYFTEIKSNYPDFFISNDIDKYITICHYKIIEELNKYY